MKTHMYSTTTSTMNESPNFSVGGIALVGFELAGSRGKNGVRTKGIAQRRARRRTQWVPVWAAVGQ